MDFVPYFKIKIFRKKSVNLEKTPKSKKKIFGIFSYLYHMNLQENIHRIKQVMGLKEDTMDYGNLHPAIVSELYNALFDNNIFLEPEPESTYGGRHFYIRMKDTKSAMDITINYAIDNEPTIAIHTYDPNGLTEKGLNFQDAIDLILSYKDYFMDFNEAVANYRPDNQR